MGRCPPAPTCRPSPTAWLAGAGDAASLPRRRRRDGRRAGDRPLRPPHRIAAGPCGRGPGARLGAAPAGAFREGVGYSLAIADGDIDEDTDEASGRSAVVARPGRGPSRRGVRRGAVGARAGRGSRRPHRADLVRVDRSRGPPRRTARRTVERGVAPHGGACGLPPRGPARSHQEIGGRRRDLLLFARVGAGTADAPGCPAGPLTPPPRAAPRPPAGTPRAPRPSGRPSRDRRAWPRRWTGPAAGPGAGPPAARPGAAVCQARDEGDTRPRGDEGGEGVVLRRVVAHVGGETRCGAGPRGDLRARVVRRRPEPTPRAPAREVQLVPVGEGVVGGQQDVEDVGEQVDPS